MNIYTNLDAFPQANWTQMTIPPAVRQRERGLDRVLDIFEALRAARRPLRPNEIASQLELSTDASRSHLKRAKATLRTLYKERFMIYE